MKQNKYDEETFFSAYEQMPRSVKGLEGAGEWHVLQALIPEQQASSVTGVDLSEKMLQKARENTDDPFITYIKAPIEDIQFTDSQFDVVISSLAFHYIMSFETICRKVYAWLKPGGSFIFSVEHPIFTSRSEQDWYSDDQGNRLHWPVDHYQSEGIRETSFLTENVVKYHRTLSTYLNDLISSGFNIRAVKEPMPSDELLQTVPEMKDENRRPMFLIISAAKGPA
ncbi:class I SAM-dependent methyltransferase [Paenibacillus sp. FJAT-26967]|uniref:class I SAM-dependent methyltransferase n=1 Tax=Paenibacillus sp. FJAT-26967 TaxID=1729690 RepID=UPI000838059B|nr:class I SAM-dependent methyltransferase [Paenibacillus sp. FJAT-26967]